MQEDPAGTTMRVNTDRWAKRFQVRDYADDIVGLACAGLLLAPTAVEAGFIYDAAIIVTDHDAIDYQMLTEQCRLIIGPRNTMDKVRGGQAQIVRT